MCNFVETCHGDIIIVVFFSIITFIIHIRLNVLIFYLTRCNIPSFYKRTSIEAIQKAVQNR